MTTTTPPRQQSVAGRALLASLLLLGFYLLGFAIIAALAAINIAFLANGRLPVRILIVSAVVAFALLRGMFFVERRGAADEVNGIEVTDRDEPRLWAAIRELAQRLGTEPPKRVYLTPDVNAFVFQRSRLMGMVPGDRVMGIGVPLLHVLSVDEMRGVLAHEFGHYTGGDTRLGPLVYRGRASIGRTIGHLGEDSWLAGVFRAYGKLYLRVSQAVSRRQELAADAHAAQVVGPAVHASALRRVHVADPVFNAFVDRYVAPLWSAQRQPRDLYAGFRAFHDHPDHEERRNEVANEMEAAPEDKYDSHPSLGVRLAALGATAAAERPDAEPARTLLDHADAIDERMSNELTKLALDGRVLPPVEWDDDAAATMLEPVVRQDSERLHAAVASVTGAPGGIDVALDLVNDGRVVDLAYALDARMEQVDPQRREQVGRALVADVLAGAVGAALTSGHGWKWALRWNGGAALVAPTGKPWEYFKAVEEAIEDPARIPALRARLRAEGLPA